MSLDDAVTQVSHLSCPPECVHAASEHDKATPSSVYVLVASAIARARVAVNPEAPTAISSALDVWPTTNHGSALVRLPARRSNGGQEIISDGLAVAESAAELGIFVEPMTGIEPAYSAWEADVLPLNYIGTGDHEG